MYYTIKIFCFSSYLFQGSTPQQHPSSSFLAPPSHSLTETDREYYNIVRYILLKKKFFLLSDFQIILEQKMAFLNISRPTIKKINQNPTNKTKKIIIMLWTWTFRINCQAKIQDDFLCCYKMRQKT